MSRRTSANAVVEEVSSFARGTFGSRGTGGTGIGARSTSLGVNVGSSRTEGTSEGSLRAVEPRSSIGTSVTHRHGASVVATETLLASFALRVGIGCASRGGVAVPNFSASDASGNFLSCVEASTSRAVVM